MALFRSLFAGRDDVYALRWENERTGKGGWGPAVAGGWANARRPDREYLPFTDDVASRHLAGQIHAGLYPLLRGDTCRLLVCDFDGPGWVLDSLAYLDAARVALVAHAPKLRSIPKIEQRAWNPEQLQAFLRSAAGHRLFAAFWLAANTGVRRSELLGLQWDDVDLNAGTMSVNRGIVAVAYELHESRGKTRNSRRRIDLDPTTVAVLHGWHAWQQAERAAVAGVTPRWVFADPDGNPIHPHAISQAFERLAARASIPIIRLHKTCATPTPRC